MNGLRLLVLGVCISGTICAAGAGEDTTEDAIFALIDQARHSERDGDSRTALEKLDRAYLLARASMGEESAPVAVLFSEAGRIHLNRGDATQAVQHYGVAVQVLSKLIPAEQFPSGHPEMVVALGNLANALRQAGRLKEAEPVAARAVTMASDIYPVKHYPKGHPHLASCWNTYGVLLQELGRLNEARESLQVALDIRRLLYPADRFPSGHRELAITISNLANLDRMRCDYTMARAEHAEAEAMWLGLYPSSRFPKGHADLARLYNNRGALASEVCDYAEARDCHERALNIYRELHADTADHPDLARAHHNLGAALERLGEMAQAGIELQEALAMYTSLVERGAGAGVRRELAWCCDSLGRLERAQGRLQEAAAYHEAALAHRKQCFPENEFPQGHSELARSHELIGNVAKLQGRDDDAIPALEQAVAINRGLYPPDQFPHGHRELARGLNNLATAYHHAGRHKDAVTAADEAVRLMRDFYPPQQFPAGHEDLAIVLGNRGSISLNNNNVEQGVQDLREAVAMLQRLPYEVAAELSEAEAVSLSRRLPDLQDRLIVSWLAAHRSLAELYPVIWNSKGALLRMLSRRQELWRDSERPELQQQFQQYQHVRKQLAALYLRPARTTHQEDKDVWRARLGKLQREKEQLERQLAAATSKRGDQRLVGESTPEQLAERLPAGSAVVDFYIYRSPADEPDRARLLAFVVGRQQEVQAHDLGPAREILASIGQWRETIYAKSGSKGGDPLEATQARQLLRRRVWEPIERLLPAGTETIYVVPDGPLSLLPWSALPGRRAETFLIEDYALALAPHATLLARHFETQPDQSANENLLAVGGVEYQQPPAPLETSFTVHSHKWTSSDADYKSLLRDNDPDFLPGTLIEARFAAYCGRRYPTLLCTGTNADADQVADALSRARWAVLTTHGGYRSLAVPSGKDSVAWQSDWLSSAQDRNMISGRSPLLRTYLELAGSRQAGAVHDARLSAERIAALPLEDLTLVFLSACESGLGDLEAGEGIYNLPRAFHQAGSRNVVASLWRVNDFASQAMMRLVYYKVFVEHHPPIIALRDAQRTLLRYPQELLAWDGTRPLKVNLDAAPQRPPSIATSTWAAFYLSGSGFEP